MRVHYLPIWLALLACLVFSAAQTFADIALPPKQIKPYNGSKPDVTCHVSGKMLIVSLHTPGPCDYTVELCDEDGKSLEGPKSGSLQHFGGQSFAIQTELCELQKGESRELRYKAQGHLYNYRKVPIAENEEGRLATLGKNLLQHSDIAESQSFSYELKDKNGKAFDFDLPIVLKADERGITAQCKVLR